MFVYGQILERTPNTAIWSNTARALGAPVFRREYPYTGGRLARMMGFGWLMGFGLPGASWTTNTRPVGFTLGFMVTLLIVNTQTERGRTLPPRGLDALKLRGAVPAR